MNYKQHKFVGDSIILGTHVSIPKNKSAKGRILFSQKEDIESTDSWFLDELKSYNAQVANTTTEKLRLKIEHSGANLEVRRSFGDVNAWSGDHAKLHPTEGTSRKFDSDHISLQEVANSHDFEYAKLAIGNWDHFMPLSYHTWANFHKEAIRFATAFKNSSQKGYRTVGTGNNSAVIFDIGSSDLAKALFLEAYGCHFLQDCFAAGHLRTPRLLFGKNPLIAVRSKDMHDEDNTSRLAVMNKAGHYFNLIGESDEDDDFTKLTAGIQDPQMTIVLKEVQEAMTAAIQQVLDYAYREDMPKKINFIPIRNLIPRIQVSWRELESTRSHTHALEIWPVAQNKTPNPLYKIHANYNPKKSTFEDPILIKRSSTSGWRRIFLGNEVNAFTPGKKLAWWIPTHPEQKKYIP